MVPQEKAKALILQGGAVPRIVIVGVAAWATRHRPSGYTTSRLNGDDFMRTMDKVMKELHEFIAKKREYLAKAAELEPDNVEVKLAQAELDSKH